MATIRTKNNTEPSTPTSGYTELYVDGSTKTLHSKDDAGLVLSYATVEASISDAAFGVGWNGDATSAPSKNAVYDEMILKAPLSGKLSQFAATTSAEIAGVISDETGSGALVFATNPAIPNITPATNFTLTQNSVVPFTSVESGAAVNTLYLSAGNVGIGTTTLTARLQIGDAITPTQSTLLGAISARFNTLSSSTASGSNFGISSVLNTNISANSTTTVLGGYFESTNPLTNTFNVGAHRGIGVISQHLGTGTGTSIQGAVVTVNNGATSGALTSIQGTVTSASTYSATTTTNVTGGQFSANNFNTGSGIATNVTGVYGFIQNGISGTPVMTDASAIRSNLVQNTGTIATYYGLKVDQTGPGTITTNYGIYQSYAAGMNVFYGNTRIGSTTNPTVALDVTGAALISSTLGVTGNATCGAMVTGTALTANGAMSFKSIARTNTEDAQVAFFASNGSTLHGFFNSTSPYMDWYDNTSTLRLRMSTAGVAVTGTLSATDNLILPKTSGVGIKVDTATPTFGWRDITGEVDVRGSGAADPTFAVYTGTNFRQLSFSATVMQECFINFHIPHDYVPGTDIYFHANWSNAAAVPNTGNVIWGFEYSYAKGFSQEAFPASSTITVTQASSATRYMHQIAETTAVTIAALTEPDGIILCRVYRNAADGGDTCTNAVFLHAVDVHYQSTNMATKNKVNNFYT